MYSTTVRFTEARLALQKSVVTKSDVGLNLKFFRATMVFEDVLHNFHQYLSIGNDRKKMGEAETVFWSYRVLEEVVR